MKVKIHRQQYYSFVFAQVSKVVDLYTFMFMQSIRMWRVFDY